MIEVAARLEPPQQRPHARVLERESRQERLAHGFGGRGFFRPDDVEDRLLQLGEMRTRRVTRCHVTIRNTWHQDFARSLARPYNDAPHGGGMRRLAAGVIAWFVMAAGSALAAAQPPAGGGQPAAPGRGRSQEPGPTITVQGHTFTQLSLFQRNVGGPDDMTTPFPPHKVIGNIYYVGTKSLAVFLVTTPQGHILINSTYERNVPAIQKSVEQLGFKFTDIKILLGSHAHGDHQEGDALVKQLTGAQVIATAEDVPALRAMKPGGKEHPIDRVLHDGDTVALGGTTLVAHLTPGHTRG